MSTAHGAHQSAGPVGLFASHGVDQLVVHSLVSTSQALGCSPGLHVPVRLALFLENLSYSFDASQMVLAVLLNVRGPVQISLFKTALPDFALKANLL